MFNDRMKDIRKWRGMTQKDIATALHVAMGTVGNWEAGNRLPDHTMLVKLADILGTSADYLLGRTDDLFRHLDDLCNKKGIAFSDAMQQAGFTEKEINDYYEGKRGVIFSHKDALCKVLGDDPDKWSTLVFSDNIPTDEKRKPASQDVPERNIVRIAGRNGTFEERHLTDEQLAALEAILRQMPNIEDDNL